MFATGELGRALTLLVPGLGMALQRTRGPVCGYGSQLAPTLRRLEFPSSFRPL